MSPTAIVRFVAPLSFDQISDRNASTTFGSKCLPACSRIWSRTLSSDQAAHVDGLALRAHSGRLQGGQAFSFAL